MTKPDLSADSARAKSRRVWLFLLLGFCGGGTGVLLALLLGIETWSGGARLFLWGGIALGVAVAAVLAPRLIPSTPSHRS